MAAQQGQSGQPTSQDQQDAGSNESAAAHENAIRWAPRRPSRKAPAATPAAERPQGAKTTSVGASPSASSPDHTAIPEDVRRHFVQVGNRYFFRDGARAFTDRTAKLTTPSENTQVIADLVAIARARGWQHIAVSGTPRFRKEAWLAAQVAGLDVSGYRADAFDRERVARANVRRAEASTSATPRPGRQRESKDKSSATPHTPPGSDPNEAADQARKRLHRGRLIEHGPAPYRHDPRETMSYFVKLETPRGDRELWGVDLERAFRQSLSRPQRGDEVVVRAVRQDPVTVKAHRRDETGAVVQAAVATHRNRWIVEKQTFLDGRHEAARTLRDPTIAPAEGSGQHPELVGAYLQVHAAELAANQFRDAADRQRFVAMVRGALADDVKRGEPLPAVRLRPGERETNRRTTTRVSLAPDAAALQAAERSR